MDKLVSNPVFIIITSLIGVVGTLATAYALYYTIRVYRLSKKLPRYTIRSFPLFIDLPGKIPELDVHYSGYGIPIKNLTITKILFWNAGTTAIRKADVPPTDRIIIRFDGECKILHAEVVKHDNPASQFEVKYSSRDRNNVIISFEFMDWNQPFLVKIIHTGTSTKDLTLTGQVIEAGPFVLIPYEKFVSTSRPRSGIIPKSAAYLGKSKFGVTIGVLMSFIAVLRLFQSLFNIYHYFTSLPAKEAWSITQYEIIIFGPLILYLGMVEYYTLTRLPPKFFDEFEAEV